MWKWIVGAVLLLAATLFATCYVFIRRATSGGDTVTVAIAASPARVWASLANVDSMATWMRPGTRVTATRHGIVASGDTLHIESGSDGAPPEKASWVVADVTPGSVLVLEIRSDSTGMTLASRRDSLVSAGDSTLVVSTIAAPMIESLRAERGDSGGRLGGAVLDIGSKMMVSAFRLLSEQDLRRLKARLEGARAAPR